MSNSAPIKGGPLPNGFSFHSSRNMSDILVPEEMDIKNEYLFLHANNNMWLEILKDGTVKANTCPTKYGKFIISLYFLHFVVGIGFTPI